MNISFLVAVVVAIEDHPNHSLAFAEEAMASILARFAGTVDCNVNFNDIICVFSPRDFKSLLAIIQIKYFLQKRSWNHEKSTIIARTLHISYFGGL